MHKLEGINLLYLRLSNRKIGKNMSGKKMIRIVEDFVDVLALERKNKLL